MTKEDIYKAIDEILVSISAGFTLSGVGALIVPEVIHAIFVIITGCIGAVVIYFTNRFLKQRFP